MPKVTTTPAKLGERLEMSRNHTGLTQEAFAEKIGAHKRSVIRWEQREDPKWRGTPNKNVMVNWARTTGFRRAWIEAGDGPARDEQAPAPAKEDGGQDSLVSMFLSDYDSVKPPPDEKGLVKRLVPGFEFTVLGNLLFAVDLAVYTQPRRVHVPIMVRRRRAEGDDDAD